MVITRLLQGTVLLLLNISCLAHQESISNDENDDVDNDFHESTNS